MGAMHPPHVQLLGTALPWRRPGAPCAPVEWILDFFGSYSPQMSSVIPLEALLASRSQSQAEVRVKPMHRANFFKTVLADTSNHQSSSSFNRQRRLNTAFGGAEIVESAQAGLERKPAEPNPAA